MSDIIQLSYGSLIFLVFTHMFFVSFIVVSASTASGSTPISTAGEDSRAVWSGPDRQSSAKESSDAGKNRKRSNTAPAIDGRLDLNVSERLIVIGTGFF